MIALRENQRSLSRKLAEIHHVIDDSLGLWARFGRFWCFPLFLSIASGGAVRKGVAGD